jgi:hypothetical protein
MAAVLQRSGHILEWLWPVWPGYLQQGRGFMIRVYYRHLIKRYMATVLRRSGHILEWLWPVWPGYLQQGRGFMIRAYYRRLFKR